MAEKSLDKLVGRLYCLESAQRDCVLHPRIVRVKSDDIVDAHANQLLKSKRAVQRLAGSTPVLAALIEERHNDIDAAAFSAYSRDDPLQVLEMIVRGHVVDIPRQRVCYAVVADVHHQVQVLAADRFGDNAFRLT